MDNERDRTPLPTIPYSQYVVCDQRNNHRSIVGATSWSRVPAPEDQATELGSNEWIASAIVDPAQ